MGCLIFLFSLMLGKPGPYMLIFAADHPGNLISDKLNIKNLKLIFAPCHIIFNKLYPISFAQLIE